MRLLNIVFITCFALGAMAQSPTACPTWKKSSQQHADRGDYLEQMRKSYGKKVVQVQPEKTEEVQVQQETEPKVVKRERNTTSTGLKLSDVFDIPEKKEEKVEELVETAPVVKEEEKPFVAAKKEEEPVLASSTSEEEPENIADASANEASDSKELKRKKQKPSLRKAKKKGSVKKVRGLRKDKTVRCATKF